MGVLKLPPHMVAPKKNVVNVTHLQPVEAPAFSPEHYTLDEVKKAFAEAMDSAKLDALVRETVESVVEKAMSSDDLDAKLSEAESEPAVETEVIKSEGAEEAEGSDLPEAPGGEDDDDDDDPDEVEKALAFAEYSLELGDLGEVEKALGGIKKYIKRWKEKGVWRYLYPGDKKGGERSKKQETPGESKPSGGEKKEPGKPAPGMSPSFVASAQKETANLNEKYGDKGKVRFSDGSDGNKFGYYFTPRGTDKEQRIGGSSPTEVHAYLREFTQPNSKGRAQQRDAFEKTKELKQSADMQGEIKYQHEGDDFGYYYHPPGGGSPEFLHSHDLNGAAQKLEKNLKLRHEAAADLNGIFGSAAEVSWSEKDKSFMAHTKDGKKLKLDKNPVVSGAILQMRTGVEFDTTGGVPGQSLLDAKSDNQKKKDD